MTNTTKPSQDRSDRDSEESRKGTDEGSPKQGHMGAEENKVQPNKPATQELAEMTSKNGEASRPEDDDYSPDNEITPG